jgi:hypothetical protein
MTPDPSMKDRISSDVPMGIRLDAHILPHSQDHLRHVPMPAAKLQPIRGASVYESQCSKLTIPPTIAIHSSPKVVATWDAAYACR